MSDPGIFRRTFSLSYPDADASGSLRLTALLNLLQLQAWAHSARMGFDHVTNFEADLYWVLARLSVRCDSWPHWPGDVTMDTWIRGTKSLFALRDFRFGSQEGTWTGRASAAFVLLKDRKPQRLEGLMPNSIRTQPEEPLAVLPAALPAFVFEPAAESRAEPLFRQSRGVWADWEDVDMNGHVNNVSAIGWCLSQHEFTFLNEYRPEHLEANFLAEMFCDQKFQILRQEIEGEPGLKTFDYLVVRETDQANTLRLRMSFRKS